MHQTEAPGTTINIYQYGVPRAVTIRLRPVLIDLSLSIGSMKTLHWCIFAGGSKALWKGRGTQGSCQSSNACALPTTNYRACATTASYLTDVHPYSTVFDELRLGSVVEIKDVGDDTFVQQHY